MIRPKIPRSFYSLKLPIFRHILLYSIHHVTICKKISNSRINRGNGYQWKYISTTRVSNKRLDAFCLSQFYYCFSISLIYWKPDDLLLFMIYKTYKIMGGIKNVSDVYNVNSDSQWITETWFRYCSRHYENILIYLAYR